MKRKKSRQKAIDLFYRVENLDGRGPYNSGGKLSFINRHNSSPKHPGPQFDEGFMKAWEIDHDWLFGFSSLEQLFEWFSVKEVAELQSKGFFISQIPIEKVYQYVLGKKQVMLKY